MQKTTHASFRVPISLLKRIRKLNINLTEVCLIALNHEVKALEFLNQKNKKACRKQKRQA